MAGSKTRRFFLVGFKRSRLLAWVVLTTLLANLALPVMAHGAASWASRVGEEMLAICTAQGMRLVPLAVLATEAINPEGPHKRSPSGPAPGSGPGHCDACLSGVGSLATTGPDPVSADAWMCASRAPQVAILGLVATLRSSGLRPPSRGPPSVA